MAAFLGTVLAILKDKEYKTKGIKILLDTGDIKNLRTNEVSKLKANNQLFLRNAEIYGNGYVRGKRGVTLPVELLKDNAPKLLEKIVTHTSKGMLSKGWYSIDGKTYLVKGAYKGEYNPIAEVIGSEIAYKLSGMAIKYTLDLQSKFPEINSTFKYVSICKKWELNKTMPFYKYADMTNKKEVKDYFGWAYRKFNQKQIYDLAMLLFIDAIIGNKDRHLGNFDINLDTGDLAPYMDFGMSCLSDNVADLSKVKGISPDKAKPFDKTHLQQIKKVKLLLSRDKQKLKLPDIKKVVNSVLDSHKDFLMSVNEQYYITLREYLNNRVDRFTEEMKDFIEKR